MKRRGSFSSQSIVANLKAVSVPAANDTFLVADMRHFKTFNAAPNASVLQFFGFLPMGAIVYQLAAAETICINLR